MGYKTRRSPGRFCRTLLFPPFYSFGGWDTYRAYTGEYPIPPGGGASNQAVPLSASDSEKLAGNDWKNIGGRQCQTLHLDSCGIFKDAVLSILATIAKQERIRLSERTVAGLEKARKQGRIGGRPRLIVNRAKVAAMEAEGLTMREIAEELGVSAASVCRILKGNSAAA